MNADRFQAITDRYNGLRIGILGDICLDRYLEIDPGRSEISIETQLTVHNVIRVRSQPGAAGTILNNLVALGIGTLYPIGFHGDDGEGYELRRALAAKAGVRLDHFVQTSERRTFTYCKPLLMHPGRAPEELNRLDSKNWTSTPDSVQDQLLASLEVLAPSLDALILMDQVDIAETGVVTRRLLDGVGRLRERFPHLFIVADSRRGLKGFPSVAFKMNQAELGTMLGRVCGGDLAEVQAMALEAAKTNGNATFITLAERGIVGAKADGTVAHVPSLPIRGEIDIVGAGDSVTANLTAALASGASLAESMEIAMAGASEVIHQLGTTGTASVAQVRNRLALSARS